MKKILTEIEWFLDFYIGYMLTNGNKTHVYHDRMVEKWGKRYTDTIPEDAEE